MSEPVEPTAKVLTIKEQAEKIVEAAKLEKGNPARAARLEKLSPELRRHVNLFWGLTDKGRESEREEKDSEISAFFGRTNIEKTAMLEAMYGSLTPLVRDVLAMSLPYQPWGYTPFRSSGTAVDQSSQREWMKDLASAVNTWDQPLEWYATHCTRMGYSTARTFAPIFAAAINAGDSSIFEILKNIVNNKHPMGVMDDHVLKGLLMSERPDGWELIEKLLVAAQRQEGLRQSIFWAVTKAHPNAFKRMMRLMLEHDLLRFSSSIQFLTETLPILPPEPTPKQVKTAFEQFLQILEDDADRDAIISNTRGASPLEVYLGLWCEATNDTALVLQLIDLIWLQSENADHRFAALRVLSALRLDTGIEAIHVKAHQDEDLRVIAQVMLSTNSYNPPQFEGAFDLLENLLGRVPKKLEFENPIAPGNKLSLDPNDLGMRLSKSLGKLPITRLIPHWGNLPEHGRRETLELIGKQKSSLEPELRALMLNSVADAATYVRSAAFEGIEKKKIELSDPEFLLLEGLLSRKRTDMRKGIIKLILRQPEAKIRASGERLSAAKSAGQKAAGNEISGIQDGKAAPETQISLRNGLGLFDPEQRTKPIKLEPMTTSKKGVLGAIKKMVGLENAPALTSAAALECIKSLGKLIDKHASTPLQLKRSWSDELYDTTLGQAWFENVDPSKPFAEQGEKLLLREIWEEWNTNRKASERDPDGFELIRALFAMQQKDWNSRKRPESLEALFNSFHGKHVPSNPDKLTHSRVTRAIIEWLIRLHPVAGMQDFILQAAEHTLALLLPILETEFKAIPEKELKKTRWDRTEAVQFVMGRWTGDDQMMFWFQQAGHVGMMNWTNPQRARVWELVHAMDLNSTYLESRIRCLTETLLIAWQEGKASETDVLDELIGSRSFMPDTEERHFESLRGLTQRKTSVLLEKFPTLKPVLSRVIERVLEVEYKRGDLPTAASAAAGSIASLEGSETLLKLLVALGKTPFIRGYSSYSESRSGTFSSLIRSTFPKQSDTPEEFAAMIKASKIPEQKLLELGLYAPQWAKFVAHATGWDGAREGIWWLHAHTKSNDWYTDQTVKDGFKAEIAEQTPLTSEDLLEGAVDVKWFQKVHAQLGEARWKQLYEAAKYACSGTGHTRAKLFADAMLDKLNEKDLLERIQSKRHQDSVRAIGLLPLGNEPEKTTLERYKAIQEFLRTSKKAGGQQKQASESLAARIGLQNLARTTGYADPTRLTWAMETDAVADLKDGPISIEWDGITLELSINPLGEPELEVSKAGKVLKDIPASLKKSEAVIAIRERKKELERQVSRMRSSLEAAMIRGDQFAGSELVKLFDHPMLRAMLKNLIWMVEGDVLPAFGFPEAFDPQRFQKSGKLEKNDPYQGSVGALYDYNGVDFVFKADDKLRIAHPHDLYTHEVWAQFQASLFDQSKLESILRVQPFKQVFRELYPLTPGEADHSESLRYAGYQVNPKQSIALLGARGWVARYEEGISKTFFDENVTAWLESNQGWTTPSEVEAPKLEKVYFTKRGDWKKLKLSEIPPRVFSEVMRDVDLVVSVAHVGGVDPEASMSTTEMRTAMVRETCRLLKLENVRIEKNLVLIDGQLNKYSVHLGSGTVHQLPGGYVCIVAVQSQQRGRVFLPFADNDPRTAEVIAKVMLLSKDSEIQDPIITRQIA